MTTSAPVPYDPDIAKALAGLEKYTDQRPSSQGFSPSIFEIDRMTVSLIDRNTEEVVKELLVVPVMLREVRSYWARKGAGDAPDCRSTDGIKPAVIDDVEPQAATCAACPWNKFGTAEQGAGKKCKTKAVLFAVRVGADGTLIDGVVLRFSASNRAVNASIMAADKASAAAGVPRPLSVWKVGVGVQRAKNPDQQDYVYLKPEFAGTVRKDQAAKVVALVQELGPDGGADRFLAGAPATGAD